MVNGLNKKQKIQKANSHHKRRFDEMSRFSLSSLHISSFSGLFVHSLFSNLYIYKHTSVFLHFLLTLHPPAPPLSLSFLLNTKQPRQRLTQRINRNHYQLRNMLPRIIPLPPPPPSYPSSFLLPVRRNIRSSPPLVHRPIVRKEIKSMFHKGGHAQQPLSIGAAVQLTGFLVAAGKAIRGLGD